MLSWNDISESKNPDTPKFYLIFWSDKKETLESLEKMIITANTRCEHCGGEVTPSDGMYLCLSSCGHVKGKME